MTKNVTIFTHYEGEGETRLTQALKAAGFKITSIFTPSGGLETFAAPAPDLLVVMGGPMGVYEADERPHLKKELEILKTRTALDKPTLGICLGAQLLAGALGAKVYKGSHGFEIGWCEIQATEAGRKGPVRHLDSSETRIFQWHQDTFDLPEGATLLANGALYKNQIFSYGSNIMAVQAHPELLESQIDIWDEDIKDEALRRDIKNGTPEYLPVMQRQFDKFMQEWLRQTGLI